MMEREGITMQLDESAAKLSPRGLMHLSKSLGAPGFLKMAPVLLRRLEVADETGAWEDVKDEAKATTYEYGRNPASTTLQYEMVSAMMNVIVAIDDCESK